MKTSSRSTLLSFLFCLLITVSGWAKFMAPELVPVDRLLASATAYLAKHPKDAEAHYTLARIHYLAFSMKDSRVPAFPNRGDEIDNVRVAADWMRGWGGRNNGEEAKPATPPTKSELVAHAAKAFASFNEAMRLDPKNGLYALGLASLLDEFRLWDESAKPEGVPPELQTLTLQRVREAYTRAFTEAMVADAKLQALPIAGLKSIVANESASALIRLAKEHPGSMTEEDRQQLKRAEEAMAKFAKLPMRAVTPIVFSLHAAAHLDELLDAKRVVDFDLRGFGSRERWPWVKPELGFLVWDPLETGRIQSARQMFGGYTFQIFRRTGYDALAALDNDANGELAGTELTGLSVWFDQNSDGRSTAAEVTPLQALGVESLAVTALSRDGIHPMNPRGLTLRGGRTLPTWDWIVAPVR